MTKICWSEKLKGRYLGIVVIILLEYTGNLEFCNLRYGAFVGLHKYGTKPSISVRDKKTLCGQCT